MANWISSKLKAAETILQQIDQQAADSLRKNEKSQTHDEVFETPAKSGSPVSLKDQLKKKTLEGSDYDGGSQRSSFEQSPSSLSSSKAFGKPDQPKDRTSSVSQSSPHPKPTLTDSDWTKLLSTPHPGTSTSKARSTNGTSVVRGLKKDGKKHGNSGSNLLASGGKKSEKSSGDAIESRGRLHKQPNGKKKNGEDSRSSGFGMQTNTKSFDGGHMEHTDAALDISVKPKHKDTENNVISEPPSPDYTRRSAKKIPPQEALPNVGKADGRKSNRADVWRKQVKREVSQSTISEDLKRKDSLMLSAETDSDSDSDSSIDSEREREREERRRKREKIFAEKVAAKAVGAIEERENVVARLEGEKQSLEKILEERAKQQAQEASELQTTMMETMDAVELEKQKHNNTRMEVLARLAGLETANADLARSFAAGQKKLETQIDHVAELREQVGLKESALKELRQRISNYHQSGKYSNELAASGGSRFEHEMLEAECSLLTDKIGRLQDKANKLVADIGMVRKEIEEPTEVEIELKRRLNQLTDHLIQKQSQVEALSSEKATLLFRIEAVSRLLEENKATSTSEVSSKDLEAGKWEFSETKLRPALQEKIKSGKKHLGTMVRQLNAIFVSGAVFLRRNPTAKIWAAVYVLCLHLWVLYILFSHSNSSSSEGKSGAVISLENFANTSHQ